MKRGLIILAITYQLLAISYSANAQEGFGVQTYLSPFVNNNGTNNFLPLGVGFGVKIPTHWVVSLNMCIAPVPIIDDRTNTFGWSYDKWTLPIELGAFIHYRFGDMNPTPYVFVGYSHFPPYGTSRDINLLHAGVGFAPFKGWFEIYPELSVVVPLQPHRYIPPDPLTIPYNTPAYGTPVYIPVMIRATIKFYLDPDIHITAWHGVQQDTSNSKGDGKQASGKTE